MNIIFQDTVNHTQFSGSGAADLENSLSGLGGRSEEAAHSTEQWFPESILQSTHAQNQEEKEKISLLAKWERKKEEGGKEGEKEEVPILSSFIILVWRKLT